MEKIGESAVFKERTIILEGFDPFNADGFTQIPNRLLKTPELSAQAKVAYAKLLSYAWNNDAVFPGQDRMAEDLGAHRTTISRAMSELETQGWIEIKRRGLGKTNIYVLKHTITPKKRR